MLALVLMFACITAEEVHRSELYGFGYNNNALLTFLPALMCWAVLYVCMYLHIPMPSGLAIHVYFTTATLFIPLIIPIQIYKPCLQTIQ